MLLVLKGFLLGAFVAAPVGPMSLLCMRRALTQGWLAGASTGLGIALADGCYAACAAFGVAAVSSAVSALRLPLHLVGGAALYVLGVQMMRAGLRSNGVEKTAPISPLAAFVTTFALTIVNPATIIAFAGIYAGALPLRATLHPQAAALLVLGTLFGSLCWWLALSGVVAGTRHLLSLGAMRAVRTLSAAGLIAFGAVALVTR